MWHQTWLRSIVFLFFLLFFTLTVLDPINLLNLFQLQSRYHCHSAKHCLFMQDLGEAALWNSNTFPSFLWITSSIQSPEISQVVSLGFLQHCNHLSGFLGTSLLVSDNPICISAFLYLRVHVTLQANMVFANSTCRAAQPDPFPSQHDRRIILHGLRLSDRRACLLFYMERLNMDIYSVSSRLSNTKGEPRLKT